ncbi:MAG: hypothetical protein JW894_09000 [Bacteroidales bacterium]|nr:hypothetical protein [Bacteroidales bacterium]
MEQHEVIETIGSITKMEHLRSLEDNVLENSLVLASVDPFPGYRTDQDSARSDKPQSTYIILRYRYAPEKINRINKDLAIKRITRCYPSFGEILTRDSILPCIRLKGIDDLRQIPMIQDYFKQNDLKLMAYRDIEGSARIKIFKTFKLIEIAEGLYRDLNDSKKIYIKIPHAVNWKRFDYISKKIKFNLKNRNFDAALGIIYRFCGPEDVIRIYDHDKTLERALLLKKHFIKQIKSDMLISANLNLPEF